MPSTAVLQAVLQVLQAVLQSISSKTTRLIQNFLPKSSSTTHSQRSHASGIQFVTFSPGRGQEHQVLNLRSFTWPLLSSLGVPSPSGGAFAARAREALRARCCGRTGVARSGGEGGLQ